MTWPQDLVEIVAAYCFGNPVDDLLDMHDAYVNAG
jgi:hypothetical protein